MQQLIYKPKQWEIRDWSGATVDGNGGRVRTASFAGRWVGTDTNGRWDVSEMEFSPYLSCVRLPLHEKGRGHPKHTLSFWVCVPSLEKTPLPLKCEICLETCRLNFVWRDYLHMGVKREFPACFCTSKSLALNCLRRVNKG